MITELETALAPTASPPPHTRDDRGLLESPLEHASIAERAGRLVDRYGELYAKHCHGAQTKRVRTRPALDWQEACSLVATWDDETLEKLMVIVLTTDDEWISGTDRAFRVFAAKATWADYRLKHWEARQKGRP